MTPHSSFALAALMLCAAACTGESPPAPTAPPVAASPSSDTGKDDRPQPGRVEASVPAPLSDAALQRIVDEVMTSAYPGAHDAENGCWRYLHEVPVRDESVAYCMRPQPARQVPSAGGGTTIHLIAANANDLGDNLDYAYSAVDAGLLAAFQIDVAQDGSWTLSASAKGMEFGTAGACGCEQARLTRLGADYYGWMFTSGGMWQGVLATQHAIVAPHEGGFKDLSAIPEIREDRQDVRYAVSVVDDDAAREFYPLRVEKMRGDSRIGERTLEFDRVRWAYPVVGDM